MKLCSVVVPCYNEEESAPLFLEEMKKQMAKIPDLDFEFIFVDDGSSDRTLEVLKQMEAENPEYVIRWISFSRNFGKESALYAGLQHAKGDYVVTMDVDMQDPPFLLPEMYAVVADGAYDCAATRRVDRKGEPPIRSFFARMFYRLINKMSNADIVDGARDYRFMSRQMADAILSLEEYNRFSKGIFGWVGFQTKWIEFENQERVAGETKWSFWKLFKYSIEGIVAFTTAPLAIASVTGVILCLLSLVMVLVIFLRAIIFGDPVAGWPSMVCIIMFLGGVQLLCMGIMGLYLSKTYLETKKRPIYIVKENNE